MYTIKSGAKSSAAKLGFDITWAGFLYVYKINRKFRCSWVAMQWSALDGYTKKGTYELTFNDKPYFQ